MIAVRSGSEHWAQMVHVAQMVAVEEATRRRSFCFSGTSSDSMRNRGGGGGGDEADIKSSNPHLTGGEKTTYKSVICGLQEHQHPWPKLQ